MTAVESRAESPDEPPGPPAATTGGARRRAFRLLFACLVSVGMGQSLMFAVLPPIARRLGLTEIQIGTIFAISAAVWILTSPMWGRRSDVWGRRTVMLIGLSGYAVSMAAFAAAVGLGLGEVLPLTVVYVLMIAARCIFGGFGSATPPAAQAYVAERTPPSERASGVTTLMAAFGLGVTLGPAVVAAVLSLGLLAPFFVVAFLGLISAAAIRLFLPELIVAGGQRPAARRRMTPLDPRVRPFLAVGISLGICQAGTMQTVGFYGIDVLGMSPEAAARYAGVALTAAALAALFCQLVLVRRLRLSPRTMMRVGTAAGILAFSILVAGNSYAAMVAGLVFMGVGIGLTQPGAVAAATLSVSSRDQGAVTGLMGTTGAIGVITAPFLAMPLYRFAPHAPYVLNLALMIAALVLTLGHPRVRHLVVGGSEPLPEPGGEP